MSNSYVIDKVYDFYDNDRAVTPLRLQLDHETVISLAKLFLNNPDDYEVDGFVKDDLDELNAKCYAENFYEQWREESEDDSKTIDDFYDAAWEYLGKSVLYYVWSDELKSDCIEYYRNFSGE